MFYYVFLNFLVFFVIRLGVMRLVLINGLWIEVMFEIFVLDYLRVVVFLIIFFCLGIL